MKKYFYFFSVVFLTLISCRSNESIQMNEEIYNLRNDIASKSISEQKKLFIELSTNDKVKFWENKLQQVLTQNLSQEQKRITKEILSEIPKTVDGNYDGVRIMELAVSIAKITPRNEFLKMFVDYGDYKRDNSSYSSKFNNQTIVQELENHLEFLKHNKESFYKENSTTNNQTARELPDCNCAWTCGFYSGHHDDCKGTATGCGFLGRFPCTGHTGP